MLQRLTGLLPCVFRLLADIRLRSMVSSQCAIKRQGGHKKYKERAYFSRLIFYTHKEGAERAIWIKNPFPSGVYEVVGDNAPGSVRCCRRAARTDRRSRCSSAVYPYHKAGSAGHGSVPAGASVRHASSADFPERGCPLPAKRRVAHECWPLLPSPIRPLLTRKQA